MLPGRQRNGECHIAIMGKREKQREMGDSQHSNREATDCNLFWQNRLNRFQRPEYSVFFLPFSTSFVMKCMNALTRMWESEDRRRIPNFSVFVPLHIIEFWMLIKSSEAVHDRFDSEFGVLQKKEVIFGSIIRKQSEQTTFCLWSLDGFHWWHLYKGQISEMTPCALK